MKRIISLACLTALLCGAGTADAAQTHKPAMPMQFAKHQAWETAQDWATHHDGEMTTATFTCHRVKRTVVDCKTSITWVFTTSMSVPYPYSQTGHGRWTMRYVVKRWEARAGAFWGRDSYFLQDRFASTDPSDDKFGGTAFHFTWDAAVYLPPRPTAPAATCSNDPAVTELPYCAGAG